MPLLTNIMAQIQIDATIYGRWPHIGIFLVKIKHRALVHPALKTFPESVYEAIRLLITMQLEKPLKTSTARYSAVPL